MTEKELVQETTTDNGYPRLLHHIWIQFNPSKPRGLSDKQLRMVASWRHFNPNWLQVMWDDAMIERLMQLYPKWYSVYHSLEHPVQKVDMARLVILWRFGGLYADVDMLCLKPIDTEISRLKPNHVYLVNDYQPHKDLPPFATMIYGSAKTNNNLILSTPNKSFLWLLLNQYDPDQQNPLHSTEMQVVTSFGPYACQQLGNLIGGYSDFPAGWNLLAFDSFKGPSMELLINMYKDTATKNRILAAHGFEPERCVAMHFHDCSWLSDKEDTSRHVRCFFVWSFAGPLTTVAIMLALLGVWGHGS